MDGLRLMPTKNANRKLLIQCSNKERNLLWWGTETFIDIYFESYSSRELICNEKSQVDFSFSSEEVRITFKKF